MNTISLEEASSLHLPKWPKMELTGASVTVEQAMDILIRTDHFLTEPTDMGGNDDQWNLSTRTALGIAQINDEIEKTFAVSYSPADGTPLSPEDPRRCHNAKISDIWYDCAQHIREELGVIDTEYVHNSWASCSFIGGPHGWCSPNGILGYEDNIGKYPSVEEVHKDFTTIATAFPYVNLTATLYDGEECEDDILPVITFVVRDGQVFLTKEHAAHHHSTPIIPRRDPHMNILSLLNGNYAGEHGIPADMMRQIIARIRPVVDKHVLEARSKLAELATSITSG